VFPYKARTLSDFRVQDNEHLDGLFTHVVAVLRREGPIDLQVVTQDGIKVKAQAETQSQHRWVFATDARSVRSVAQPESELFLRP
jgi:hypothetical protein